MLRGAFNQECESIHKNEWIKLQKFQIARKKGIKLMLSFDSSIRKSAETKTQSVADNWK